MATINCPYCKTDIDVDVDECHEQDYLHIDTCSICEKEFGFRTHILFFYEPAKVDCLNGAPHEWRYTRSFPKETTQMYCTSCEDHRSMTTSEREALFNGEVDVLNQDTKKEPVK